MNKVKVKGECKIFPKKGQDIRCGQMVTSDISACYDKFHWPGVEHFDDEMGLRFSYMPAQAEDCLIFTFEGDVPVSFRFYIGFFEKWYIRPFVGSNKMPEEAAHFEEHKKDYLQSNMRKFALKQSLKMISRIEFNYHDYWHHPNSDLSLLQQGKASLDFSDGTVSEKRVEDIPIETSAENLMKLGFEKECFDLSLESLKRLHLDEIPLEHACVFKGMKDQQYSNLFEWLSKFYVKNDFRVIFRTSADFWELHHTSIEYFERDHCIISKRQGERLSKINNTMLLLSGDDQKYVHRDQYTAAVILDFFEIAGNGLDSECRQDILDFLEELQKKPRCVTMLLDTLET